MKAVKYLIITILAIGVGYAGFAFTRGNIAKEKTGGGAATLTTVPTQKPAPNFPTTIGNFLVTDREIEIKDGKPVVYFIGSSGCPHCVWEKPIMQKVTAKFKNEIDYRESYDSQNYSEVFQNYSDINPGYIPFLILGGKYVRVGAGEQLGKDDAESKKLEEEALSVILCKLTGGKPGSVCNSLKTKVSEIK